MFMISIYSKQIVTLYGHFTFEMITITVYAYYPAITQDQFLDYAVKFAIIFTI